MAEAILMGLVWIVALGFLTFVVFYVMLRPWHDPMGTHILFFMSAFLLAFIWSIIAPYIPHTWLVHGWIVVIGIIAFVVWWRVALLIRFQIQQQEQLYQIFMKIRRKLIGR